MPPDSGGQSRPVFWRIEAADILVQLFLAHFHPDLDRADVVDLQAHPPWTAPRERHARSWITRWNILNDAARQDGSGRRWVVFESRRDG